MTERVTERDVITAARDRLVEENDRLRRELLDALQLIHKMRLNRPSGTDPLAPDTSIGIVQCPKCGQYMEVVK